MFKLATGLAVEKSGLFGQLKMPGGIEAVVLADKEIGYSGIRLRKEAAGYGTVYIVEAMLQDNNLKCQIVQLLCQ
jgi:glutamate dehydrogenase/leucine dehydrogenase